MAQLEETPVDKEPNEPPTNDTETAITDQPPSITDDNKPANDTSAPQEPTEPAKDNKVDTEKANITDDTKQEIDNTDEKSPSNDANDTNDNANIKQQIVDNNKPENNTSVPQEPTEPSKDNKVDTDKPTANTKDDTKQEIDNKGPQPQDNTDEKSPSNVSDDNNTEQPTTDKVTAEEEKKVEISEEEKNIYIQINKEKESITKCINNMVESLATFDTDSQQKQTIINDTFDSLINAINNRKTSLLNELNNDILTQKSNVIKQIESMKQYQQTINEINTKYETLTNTQQNDDEKIEPDQRKQQILSLQQEFDTSFSKMTFDSEIKLRLDTEPLETAIKSFGYARIGKTSDPDYDEEKVPSFIDANTELLLAEIPVKKLFRYAKKTGGDFSWRSRATRTIILFYQNKKSYKVRMIVKENESDELLLNQWVHTNELIEKEALVWEWTGFDATIAKEAGDEKKGYTKWCAKFFDDVAYERFQDQYNQARKINLQVLENEEKIRRSKLKQERLRKQAEEVDENVTSEVHYYENDEKLCYEMDVWKTYLWGKDASGKGAWKAYGEKSLLQFFENRKKKKIRIVITENETKDLKLNHWIPTDCSLKSRGDQMWEWQVYDDLATKFLKNSTLKLATICGTFIDKKDTGKFKELFEKYQKVNQQAEAL